jgi:hypothetical protein
MYSVLLVICAIVALASTITLMTVEVVRSRRAGLKGWRKRRSLLFPTLD